MGVLEKSCMELKSISTKNVSGVVKQTKRKSMNKEKKYVELENEKNGL